MQKQSVLVVVGPTAVGKTELSLQLAEELKAQIISADSMQVYRGMDIGTAKASVGERQLVKHHLIDVVDPDQPFNVADYVDLAESVLQKLHRSNITPLLTGGTGLYIDALLDGFLFPDSSADPKLREELQSRGEQDPEKLFKELEQIDPTAAKKLHPNDLRRVVRALEVYYRTGEPISVLQRKKEQEVRPYDPLYIGLTRERAELYSRINQRVDQMIEEGLIEEVANLLKAYPQQPTALQALGYKEIVLYLQNQMTLDEAVDILKRDTRRYAKRQLSWFQRNKRIRWFDLSIVNVEEIKKEVLEIWNEQ